MNRDDAPWRDVNAAVDWRGIVFNVGELVLYPRMSGRSCEIQEGTVLAIKERHYFRQKFVGWSGEQFKSDRLYEDVPAFDRKVNIKPTHSSRNFGHYSWQTEAESRPVWIQIGENVTAVPQ